MPMEPVCPARRPGNLPSQGPGFQWPYYRLLRPHADGYVAAMTVIPPGAGGQREIERIVVKWVSAPRPFRIDVGMVSSTLRMIQNAIPSVDADQKRQGTTSALFSMPIKEIEIALTPLMMRLRT